MPLLAFSVSLNSKRRTKFAYSFPVDRLPPSSFVEKITPFSTCNAVGRLLEYRIESAVPAREQEIAWPEGVRGPSTAPAGS
jgi:hypothetical protein